MEPILECDLVMKGGITSGVVYPKAVLALKDTYRFRNIGGTSAGAIAAAAAAAAEYGRENNGFGLLEALNDDLCQQGFLGSLFQPSPKTAALLQVASAAMTSKTSSFKVIRVIQKFLLVAGKLIRYTPWAVLLGAVVGVVIGWALSALNQGTAQGVRQGVFLGLYGVLGALVGAGWALVHKLFNDVPDNGFGICIGHDPNPDQTASPKPVLIDWLIGQIDGIAGKSESTGPLTFGHLQKNQPKPIFLKMMTTNLSEEMPYVLPFENYRFLFEEAKMRDYFPRYIVDHLVKQRHKPGSDVVLPSGFFFLPDADEMPIVVAMRMSLSFPLLLSAVPLWTLGTSAFAKIKVGAALEQSDLSRNWFSDGGLSSNFPIQFFDSWLPSRPTFGIDLTSYPPEAFDTEGNLCPDKFADDLSKTLVPGHAAKHTLVDPTAPVYLPRPNDSPPHMVNALPSLLSFLGAIFSTIQNYRDNQLSQLPGYRERIVQVRLAKNEGGLNLDMPVETLREIAAKGEAAGEALKEFNADFDGNAWSRMDEHRWTRFRVLMSQLEAELSTMHDRLTPESPEEKPLFDVDRLLALEKNAGFPYRVESPAHWTAQVDTALQGIKSLMNVWPRSDGALKPDIFSDANPKPVSNLRLTPQLYEPLPVAPPTPPGHDQRPAV